MVHTIFFYNLAADLNFPSCISVISCLACLAGHPSTYWDHWKNDESLIFCLEFVFQKQQ